jgi:ABC-type antimicrobial peptide transport system permease subunit
MAFSVARRTREIGVRMALGADRRTALLMVLRSAAGMSVIGIGLGTALALALGGYVESQLYGMGAATLPRACEHRGFAGGRGARRRLVARTSRQPCRSDAGAAR